MARARITWPPYLAHGLAVGYVVRQKEVHPVHETIGGMTLKDPRSMLRCNIGDETDIGPDSVTGLPMRVRAIYAGVGLGFILARVG